MSFQQIVLSANNLRELVSSSQSLAQVCSLLGYSNNGRNTGTLRMHLEKQGIDYSHFKPWGTTHLPPVSREDRICPVCSAIFSVNLNNAKDRRKVTCGHSCANSYFRSGETAGGYIHGHNTYRLLAKNISNKLGKQFSCIICGFSDIVDVHHADEDKDNQEPSNLIPLCSNHHRLWHRDYPNNILEKIVEYQDLIDSSLA